MTSHDVCRYCGFSIPVLDRLQAQGRLMPARVLPESGKRLFLRSDVDAYMESIKRKQK